MGMDTGLEVTEATTPDRLSGQLAGEAPQASSDTAAQDGAQGPFRPGDLSAYRLHLAEVELAWIAFMRARQVAGENEHEGEPSQVARDLRVLANRPGINPSERWQMPSRAASYLQYLARSAGATVTIHAPLSWPVTAPGCLSCEHVLTLTLRSAQTEQRCLRCMMLWVAAAMNPTCARCTNPWPSAREDPDTICADCHEDLYLAECEDMTGNGPRENT